MIEPWANFWRALMLWVAILQVFAIVALGLLTGFAIVKALEIVRNMINRRKP